MCLSAKQFDNDNQSTATVKEVLLELRRFRLGLIQTAPQLYFSYKAIIEGIRHFNDPVDSSYTAFDLPNKLNPYRFPYTQSFYDYEEVPIIASNTDSDSVPPPVPPTRAASLHLNKPLPRIPHSHSVQGLVLENHTELTALAGYRPSGAERPLPPLPPKTPPCKIFDEETANDELDESDDDSDSDGVLDDDSDSNNDEREANGNANNGGDADEADKDDDDDNDDDDDAAEDSSSNDVAMHDRAPPIVPRVSSNSNGTGAGADGSFDANATLPPSPTDRTAPINGLSSSDATAGSNINRYAGFLFEGTQFLYDPECKFLSFLAAIPRCVCVARQSWRSASAKSSGASVTPRRHQKNAGL